MAQEFPVAVGQHRKFNAPALQIGQHLLDAFFKRVDFAEMLAVVIIEGSVCDLLGLFISVEQDFEDIRPRYLSLLFDLRMQFMVLAHVVDQLAIFFGLAFALRGQPIHQAQLPELRDGIVDGVIHGLQCIHQRGMPVEDDDLRWRENDRFNPFFMSF